ncbi:MAG: right-handed parallel beta-helix repeat-containing protein [Thermodesulfobacteriota bacterium]|jgi:uncharacterized protein (TIGR03437 family)
MRGKSYYGLLMSTFLLTFIIALPATAAQLFVSSHGTGTTCTQGNPCTLQTALAQANDNDTHYLARGTYTGAGDAVITVTKSVMLYGGWDGSTRRPLLRDPEAYPTTVQGEDQRQGISISGNITPTIDGFIVTGGKAPDGGGIYIKNASPLIKNNIITTNRTITGYYEDGRGGGVFVQGTSTAVIVNNKILNNNSGYGGGIYSADSGGVTVEDNLITRNTASHRAGGILAERSPDIILRNIVSSNTAAEDAGGILVWDAAPRLEENHIFDNTATSGGGISLGYNATPSLFNNLFVTNAKDGIAVFSSSPVIANNTIVGNGLSGSGYGVYLYSDADCDPPYCTTTTITNNIIVSYGIGISVSGPTTAVIDYNDAWGNITANDSLSDSVAIGTHNISLDPLFNNVATDDYHLKKGSPCIDAGIDAGVTIDIDGDLRDDGSPDIGAYEYIPVSPKEGTIGTKIHIYDLGFGTRKGKVLVGNVAPKILEWTDSSIGCQLTKAPSPGTYDVTIQPQAKGSSPIVMLNGFTVKSPEIGSVEPSSGSAGAEITIIGSFFGTKKGKVTLGGKSCKVLHWTMVTTTGESEIQFVVPKGLTPGTYELKVTTTGVGSDTGNFTVE